MISTISFLISACEFRTSFNQSISRWMRLRWRTRKSISFCQPSTDFRSMVLSEVWVRSLRSLGEFADAVHPFSFRLDFE